MSRTTSKLQLTLPDETERYDLDVFNDNFEKIDESAVTPARMNEAVSTAQSEFAERTLVNKPAMGTDPNALKEQGIYTGYLLDNFPGEDGWGTVIVIRAPKENAPENVESVMQIAYFTSSYNGIYVRAGIKSGEAFPFVWQPWRAMTSLIRAGSVQEALAQSSLCPNNLYWW